jgi:hypothetical protein
MWSRWLRPFAEAGYPAVRIGGRQCVLVDPVRRLIRRLKPIEVRDQLDTEHRRFLGAQASFCRTGRGILPIAPDGVVDETAEHDLKRRHPTGLAIFGYGDLLLDDILQDGADAAARLSGVRLDCRFCPWRESRLLRGTAIADRII